MCLSWEGFLLFRGLMAKDKDDLRHRHERFDLRHGVY